MYKSLIYCIHRFQFLIGTLKTYTHIFFAMYPNSFQFLIGTLKTLCIEAISILCISVSIPHRYSKNPSSIEYTYILQKVNIFHLLGNSCQALISLKNNLRRPPGFFALLGVDNIKSYQFQ